MSGYKGTAVVVQFPGVNCEYETASAIRSVGVPAAIFRWNENPELLEDCEAIVLPGGFSYQDRIRAGVVAAKDRVMEKVADLARRGRPVLGICNGAQVLVESGLVPGVHGERIDVALAPNVMADREGYFCTWVNVRIEDTGCFWTKFFLKEEVVPIPVAHAEGRFVTEDPEVLASVRRNGQIALRYCDAGGRIAGDFPANPNGSVDGIAGLMNAAGNVLAMMPHPERATWIRQVPEDLGGEWGRRRRAVWGRAERMEDEGPARRFFSAVLEERRRAR